MALPGCTNSARGVHKRDMHVQYVMHKVCAIAAMQLSLFPSIQLGKGIGTSLHSMSIFAWIASLLGRRTSQPCNTRYI